MNLFTMINKGVAHSGAAAILSRPNAKQRAAERKTREVSRQIASARERWLQALQVDETAAWMSLLEKRGDVLQGLCTVLGLCALARGHDDGNHDSPHVRVILGAVSATEQAGKAGSVLTQQTVQALSSAANMAREILATCSDDAIAHACLKAHHFLRPEA